MQNYEKSVTVLKISTSSEYWLGSSFKMLEICLSYQLYGINKCGEVWV